MPADRPNILVILDDQHRFDYLGCAGADWVRTPNLDRLAGRGVRFTRCFSNAPVCAPARIGLATGLMPHRVGALNNHAYLPVHTHRTYYQRLRDAGYWVGCVGKLDLAKKDAFNGRGGNRPVSYAWGFTHPCECEGKMHAGRALSRFGKPHGPYTAFLHERGLLETFCNDYEQRARDYSRSNADSSLPTDAFEDHFIGQRSAEFIRQTTGEFPWHLFVSFVGPHDPYDPPTEYADRYRDAHMPPAIRDTYEGKPGWHTTRDRKLADKEVLTCRRQYCAAIELIDDQIGQILDALEQTGQADNTFIVFASDHGEMLGDHGMFTKSVMYEPSMHVPLIVAGPGIDGRRTSEAMVELIDINATVCELAGLPAQENIDALSLAPVLHGHTDAHRPHVTAALDNCRCIRTPDAKLVLNYNDATELYDLNADPHELNNIAADRPEQVHELLRAMVDTQNMRGWQW